MIITQSFFKKKNNTKNLHRLQACSVFQSLRLSMKKFPVLIWMKRERLGVFTALPTTEPGFKDSPLVPRDRVLGWSELR